MKLRSESDFSFLGSGVGSGVGVGTGAAGGVFGCLRPDCPWTEIAQAATMSKQKSRTRDLQCLEFISYRREVTNCITIAENGKS